MKILPRWEVCVFLLLWLALESGLSEVQIRSGETCMFDWDAYSEQARRLVWGPPPGKALFAWPRNFDYAGLRGDTGPLPYPAGHAWLHAGLAAASGWDADTDTTESPPKNLTAAEVRQLPADVDGYRARVRRPAAALRGLQRGYAALHVATLALAAAAAAAAGAFEAGAAGGGGWLARLRGAAQFCVLLSLSRRVRNVASLGLFNDAPAALLTHAGALALAHAHFTWGAALLSLGVAVKMNVLLWAPGALFLALDAGGAPLAARCAAVAAALQLALAAPFLAAAPAAYITRAFDFGRAFDQRWSANLAWLPPATFASRELAAGLLAAHVALLAAAARWWWAPAAAAPAAAAADAPPAPLADAEGGAASPRRRPRPPPPPAAPPPPQPLLDWLWRGARGGPRATPRAALFILYTSNFVGVACARSLHFQFLTWYWHTLPLLLAHTRLPWPAQAAFAAALELCWGNHPPQAWSAAAITALHAALLAALWHGGGGGEPAAARAAAAGGDEDKASGARASHSPPLLAPPQKTWLPVVQRDRLAAPPAKKGKQS